MRTRVILIIGLLVLFLINKVSKPTPENNVVYIGLLLLWGLICFFIWLFRRKSKEDSKEPGLVGEFPTLAED